MTQQQGKHSAPSLAKNDHYEEAIQLNQSITHPERCAAYDESRVPRPTSPPHIPYFHRYLPQSPIVGAFESQRLRDEMLDNFVFKWGGLVCSLEHQHFRACWQSHFAEALAEQNGKISYLQLPRCMLERDNYATCLYNRFDSAMAFMSAKDCLWELRGYRACAVASGAAAATGLTTNSSSKRKIYDALIQNSDSTSSFESQMAEDEEYQPALCDDMWRQYFKCLTVRIQLDTFPLDQISEQQYYDE